MCLFAHVFVDLFEMYVVPFVPSCENLWKQRCLRRSMLSNLTAHLSRYKWLELKLMLHLNVSTRRSTSMRTCCVGVIFRVVEIHLIYICMRKSVNQCFRANICINQCVYLFKHLDAYTNKASYLHVHAHSFRVFRFVDLNLGLAISTQLLDV